MTPFKPFARLVFALVLSFAVSAALLPRPVAAQSAAQPAATTSDYTTQLSRHRLSQASGGWHK